MSLIHNHKEYWDEQQHIEAAILSESQQKILAILPHVTGALSLIGSCSILYNIWKDRSRKMEQPYYRILLGMSLFDVVVSSSICLSTIPMPVDTPGVYGARGTTQTCAASGFFNQFMLGSILYNLVLAIYYTMSGRYHMSDKEFARRYEPHLHWAAVMITVGVALGKTYYYLQYKSLLCCFRIAVQFSCLHAFSILSHNLLSRHPVNIIQSSTTMVLVSAVSIRLRNSLR